MGILTKLFGAKPEITAQPVEHAVIVAFAYLESTDLEPLFALERMSLHEGCTRDASLGPPADGVSEREVRVAS